MPDDHPGYACSQCGHLQTTTAVACDRCRYDVLLDVSRESVRELLRENDERMKDTYRDRHRMISVAGGMAIIIALMFVPGYWTVRQGYALPFLADQIILMTLVALGLHYLLDKRIPQTRYPWLEGLPKATER